jgi:hypothetical protein
MAISVYYVNLNNAHVKTEKLYASIRCDMISDLIEWVEKEKKKKMCNLLSHGICWNKEIQ